jgi:L-carnitine CoA-transferase
MGASGVSLPDFGPLAGVRVVLAGSALAGPFSAQLMAEWGADVIWIENPKVPDQMRGGGKGYWAEAERRNMRNVALDMQKPEGKAAFLSLLSSADVFIESSRGGQFTRLGLSDDVLWGANPALVITHVSGFGQYGVTDAVERACYDPIAQAYGCYMQLNGRPDAAPHAAVPVPGDYFTGLLGLGSTLAALYRAHTTGEGESIDVAMFEVLMRVQSMSAMDHLNRGIPPKRRPQGPVPAIGIGTYACGDGVDIYLTIHGAGVVQRTLQLLGIADPEMFPAGQHFVHEDSEAGAVMEKALVEYCCSRDAKDVEERLSAAGVPCSRIYTYELAEQDPHYQARGVFTDWTSMDGNPVRGIKVVPEFTRRPGQIWSGAPRVGQHNREVLEEAGLTKEQIETLYAAGVIAAA